MPRVKMTSRKTQRGTRVIATPKATVPEKEVVETTPEKEVAAEYKYSLQAETREMIETLLDNEEFAENLQDQDVTTTSDSKHELTFTSLLKMSEITKILDEMGKDATPMKESLSLSLSFSIPTKEGSKLDSNQDQDSDDESEATAFTLDAECENDVKELLKNKTFSESLVDQKTTSDSFGHVTFDFSSTLSKDEILKCLEGVSDSRKMVESLRLAGEDYPDDDDMTPEEEEVDQLFDDEDEKTDSDSSSDSDSDEDEKEAPKPKKKAVVKPKQKVTVAPKEEQLKPSKAPAVHYANTMKLFQDETAAVLPPVVFPGDVVCIGKDQKKPRFIYIVTEATVVTSSDDHTHIDIAVEPLDRLERKTKQGNMKKTDTRIISDYIIAEFGLKKYIDISEKIFQNANYTKTALKDLKKKLEDKGSQKMLETLSVEEKQYVTEGLIKALETLKL